VEKGENMSNGRTPVDLGRIDEYDHDAPELADFIAEALGAVGYGGAFIDIVLATVLTPERLAAARNAASGYSKVDPPRAWTPLQAVVLEGALALGRLDLEEDHAGRFAYAIAVGATSAVEQLANRAALMSVAPVSVVNVAERYHRAERLARERAAEARRRRPLYPV
jgi:hypothetical protein